MYTNQRLWVRWGDEMSSQFGVVNDVKQGGGGLICHMGICFIGALSFADDLNLLALG